MTDFLSRLVTRQAGAIRSARPRIPSKFESGFRREIGNNPDTDWQDRDGRVPATKQEMTAPEKPGLTSWIEKEKERHGNLPVLTGDITDSAFPHQKKEESVQNIDKTKRTMNVSIPEIPEEIPGYNYRSGTYGKMKQNIVPRDDIYDKGDMDLSSFRDFYDERHDLNSSPVPVGRYDIPMGSGEERKHPPVRPSVHTTSGREAEEKKPDPENKEGIRSVERREYPSSLLRSGKNVYEPRPFARIQSVPSDAGDQPAIRITIGRIDIRAVMTQERPLPPPPARRSMVPTHEEYLKKRNEGS